MLGGRQPLLHVSTVVLYDLLHRERPAEVDAAILGRQLVCESAVSYVAAKKHCLPRQRQVTAPRTLAALVSALLFCSFPGCPDVDSRHNPAWHALQVAGGQCALHPCTIQPGSEAQSLRHFC